VAPWDKTMKIMTVTPKINAVVRYEHHTHANTSCTTLWTWHLL